MIQFSQETLLVFHMEEEKFKKISKICAEMGIKAVLFSGEQEKAPLGLLAGARGWMNPLLMAGQRQAEPLSEEMVIMAGFSDRLLESFLGKLRQNQTPVSLKAILTDQNAVWNAGQLQAELKEERAAFFRAR